MADVVIQVACGERAGEVAGTISDFARWRIRGRLAHGSHTVDLQHLIDAGGGS